MGAFFISFWGQLGKSTGKRVSNAIYGDKWASPYRVVGVKSGNKRGRSHRKKSPARKNRYSGTNNAARQVSSKPRSYRWLYWLAGFILFCGTYNAIINPNKNDMVLIIMLWVVALIYLLFKYLRTR